MIEFLLGGFFALVIFFLGTIFGFFIGRGKLEEKVEEVVRRFRLPEKGGPVKAITPQEIRDEQEKEFRGRLKELIS